MPELLLLGDETDEASASAHRAGYGCRVVSLRQGMLAAVRELQGVAGPIGGVIACEPAERHPEAVGAAGLLAELWTPGPDAVRALNRAEALSGMRLGPGLRVAATRNRLTLAARVKAAIPTPLSRLLPGPDGWDSIPRGPSSVFQERVEGEPLEAAVWSDGWSATVLGVIQSLDRADAAPQPVDLPDPGRTSLSAFAVAVTQRFDLRGLWGIGAVLTDRGDLCILRVMPRYPRCLDVLERQADRSLLRGRAAKSSDHHPPV